MHTRKLFPIISAVCLTAGLAACGGSSTNGVESKKPAEIVATAQKAAESAKSVHVTGTVSNSGTKLSLDLKILHGTGAEGKVSEGPLSFELVRVGDSVYIKGSTSFYEHFAGSEAAKLLQGKWLKAPVTRGEFATLGTLTDISKLLSSALGQHGTLQKGGTSTVEGKQVIAVKDTTKGGVLYVATKGKPYPIQLFKAGSTGGKVTFTNWGAPVSIAAPSNSIDIEKLKAGA